MDTNMITNYDVFREPLEGMYNAVRTAAAKKRKIEKYKYAIPRLIVSFFTKEEIYKEIDRKNENCLKLIRNLSYLSFKDFVQVLNETEGLGLQAFSCDVPEQEERMEKLVLIDTSKEDLVFASIYNNYYVNNLPATTQEQNYKIYSELDRSNIPVEELQNVGKGSILKAICDYGDEDLFENFQKAYFTFLFKKCKRVRC